MQRFRSLGYLQFHHARLDHDGRFLHIFKLSPRTLPAKFRQGDFLKLVHQGMADIQGGFPVILTEYDMEAGEVGLLSRSGRLQCHKELFYSLEEDNDIALLQLASPSSMTPISGLVQTDNYVPFGTMFTTIGWGLTEFQGDYPEQLQQVSIPYVDNQTCQTTLGQEGIAVTDNMLCAGAWEGGQDTCQGDSGGPLITQELGKDVLAGVVSFGYRCAFRAKPGMYTRVSRYNGWMKNTAESEYVFDAL